jgi:gamma-glutamyltranspeptidase/glutathione hydrolase
MTKVALRFAIPSLVPALLWAQSVRVEPVTAPHGMVVSAHPEASAIGVAVLQAGGNAMDAAVATSLAVGIAEPYGSGLGGKLVMLYHDAATGTTTALEALDQAGSEFSFPKIRALGREADNNGWTAVCVPGLPAGLFEAHRRWGARPWADNVAPAVRLAREGFTVIPGIHRLFQEREDVLTRGDPEIARLYLPGGQLPAEGSRLANEDLARTLELLAQHGRDGFYRGPVAGAIVAAARKGGGWVAAEDFANYEVRFSEPLKVGIAGHTLLGVPPPNHGTAIVFSTLKLLEALPRWATLRDPASIDALGRSYLMLSARARAVLGDVPEARAAAETLIANPYPPASAAAARDGDATTHLAVVDRHGNIACLTQSLSLHFGAGVIAPGTGVVLNNTMSNFNYTDAKLPNHAAPGKRPWSTTSPIIVLEGKRPVLAIGLPGGNRIPSGLAQVLADHLLYGRQFADAMGDVRMNWTIQPQDKMQTVEAEAALPKETAKELVRLGWKVETRWKPGASSHFGGVNAIELNADGSRTGYADPRRTNSAQGH